jgi:hypothetical protein
VSFDPTAIFYNLLIGRLRFIDDVRTPLGKRYLINVQTTLDEENSFEYSMHRTLQRIVLDKLDLAPDNRQQTFDQTVALLRFHLPKPSQFMIPYMNIGLFMSLCCPTS